MTVFLWGCSVALIVAGLAGTVLPALPGVALGFLLPNADLFWRRARRANRPAPATR